MRARVSGLTSTQRQLFLPKMDEAIPEAHTGPCNQAATAAPAGNESIIAYALRSAA